MRGVAGLHMHHLWHLSIASAHGTLLLSRIGLLRTGAVLRLVALAVHVHLSLLAVAHRAALGRSRPHHRLRVMMTLLRSLRDHHRCSSGAAVSILLRIHMAWAGRIHGHLSVELLRHAHVRSAGSRLQHHRSAHLALSVRRTRVWPHLHRHLTTKVWLLPVRQLGGRPHWRSIRRWLSRMNAWRRKCLLSRLHHRHTLMIVILVAIARCHSLWHVVRPLQVSHVGARWHIRNLLMIWNLLRRPSPTDTRRHCRRSLEHS